MFKFIVIVLLLLAGTNWLLTALAKRPGSGRVLMGGCGLCLAGYMTMTGLCMLAEPELDTGFGLMFFLWAGFGVVILVKAAKGRCAAITCKLKLPPSSVHKALSMAA